MAQLHNKTHVFGFSGLMILVMKDTPVTWIRPDWPAPESVGSVMTSRQGGVSQAPWESMNLGLHVGDQPAHVQANRDHLAALTGPKPVFLQQVHGIDLLELTPASTHGQVADACWTRHTEVACTIMVADCLPVLLCDVAGQWVAAAHLGWRGLAGTAASTAAQSPPKQGVLEALFVGLSRAGADVSQVMAWLGPCIGPQAFEVGSEVKEALDDGSESAQAMFRPVGHGQFMADLAGLARLQLQALGVSGIYGNDSSAAWCTASNPRLFFSHRRDSRSLGSSGRMAACIWLER
jgi:YfiH family protein